MMRHRKIRLDLYEYLRGELPADESAKVEHHLAHCPRCADEADRLHRLLAGPAQSLPEQARPPEYWARFAEGVEQRIRAAEAGRNAVRRPVEIFRPVFHPWRRPALAALGGALAVVVVAVLLWRPAQPPPRSPVLTEANLSGDEPRATSARMEQYLRKSKILLIGLTNARPEDGPNLDLSTEREASKQLIHEARYLESQPIDPRAARLIDRLNKILIELANMKEQGNLPDVEILRGGIHQENLLFRIRMAESYYDTTATADHSY